MDAIAGNEIFLFERFRLDRRAGGLFRCDEHGVLAPVAIGSRALDVLYILVRRHGELVPKDEIMAAVWPGTVVADSNLPIQILALRRVLDHRRAGSSIQTVAGRGYRFVVPVTRAERKFSEAIEVIDAPAASAERRLLTVLSGSLGDFPRPSVELDPEELLDTMQTLYRACAEVIDEYDGFVANFSGAGLLAYFGYPPAHEDDAERAVRASLALVDVVSRFKAPSSLRARIGIATGLVVIGDVIAGKTGLLPGIFGTAPSLATRLQARAEPNTVLIADSTQRHIRTFFELDDLGIHHLGTASERVWRVLGERRGLGRFEALRSSSTPFVGREEEIAALVRLWTRAGAGDGHAVLLSGEPGVGKSRLATEFEERIRDQSHHRLRYFCSPYIRTAPSTRSLSNSNVRPGSSAMTPPNRGSKSWRGCSPRSRWTNKTSPCWPIYCHYRDRRAIRHSISVRSAKRTKPSRHGCASLKRLPASSLS